MPTADTANVEAVELCPPLYAVASFVQDQSRALVSKHSNLIQTRETCPVRAEEQQEGPPPGREVRGDALSEGTSLLADTASVLGHKAWPVKPGLQASAPASPNQRTCCPEPNSPTPCSARSRAPLGADR